MDAVEVVLSLTGGIVSGVGAVTVFAWKFGKEIQAIKSTADEAKKNVEELKNDVDELVKGSNESWQALNRTLGRIEGSLGVDPPPMRPSMKSRP